MWGPEIEMKALEGSMWGPEPDQQVQGYRPDRPIAYAGTIREFASSLEVIAKNAILANIELEAYAEELMRERDEAWGTYQREIGAKSIVEEENTDLRKQLAELQSNLDFERRVKLSNRRALDKVSGERDRYCERYRKLYRENKEMRDAETNMGLRMQLAGVKGCLELVEAERDELLKDECGNTKGDRNGNG